MKYRSICIGLAAFITIVIVWEILARIGVYNARLLPPPSQALDAFATAWGDGRVVTDLKDSGARYLPGFIFGSCLGVLLGVITGVSANTGYVLNPLLHYLRSIPPVALIPFVLVIYGISDMGKISLVAWACMLPVWLNTQIGIKQVPREYIQAAKIFGSSGWRQIIDIWLPCALPHIVGGIRIAVSTGIFALAAVEMFGASSGIGFRIVYSHQLFQTDLMVAMILLIGFIALALDLLVSALQRKMTPWEHT